jgi:hypothetical protein
LQCHATPVARRARCSDADWDALGGNRRKSRMSEQSQIALGAVIGYFDPPVGVGAIFLTQINCAIAPRLPFHSRP